MTGKCLIPKTQADSQHPFAASGLTRSRQARRNRRVRPQLDLLEERCMLSSGSTTTLSLSAFNITYGGSISATPVVSSTDAPGGIPLTGSCTLDVDGKPYGVPQAVGTTFVVTDLSARKHTLWASYSGDDNYQGSTTTSNSLIYVTAAELTVTANDYSRAYGAADPASWPYTITGFVNGDVFEQSEVVNPTAPANNPLTKATDTGSFSSVGNYTINIYQFDTQDPQDPDNLSYNDPNYVINQTFNSGTLTVTPAPLTITASDQSEVYGTDTPYAGPGAALGNDPLPDFTVTSGQLFNGDKVTSVTLFTNPTLSASSHYNAGTWPITPSAAIFNPVSSSSNYAITYANASTGFTVNPEPLYITGASAQPTTKVYDGTTKDNIKGTPTLSSLFCSYNNVSDNVIFGTAGDSANFADPNVGTSTVTLSGYTLSGADSADYALSPTTSIGTANISPATLTINVPSTQNETYGFGGTSAALGTPAFTVPPGQLFGSDTVTSVSLSIDNPKWSSSLNYDAGTYPITPSANGSGLSNYDIGFLPPSIQL